MKPQDHEQATRYSQKALTLIKKAEAVPIPQNYELFYHYVAGTNPALKKVLDDRLKTGGGMSPSELKMLHEGYATDSHDNERLSLLGERLGEEIQNALGLVAKAVNSTEDFDGSLDEVKEQAVDLTDPEKVRTVVSALVETTKEMQQNTKVLKQQLGETTGQIEQLQSDLDNVRLESQTDFLTGVANRKCFDQTLEKEVAKANLMERPLSLGMVDVDHFKKFNDTYGHPVGDSVLRMVASMLKNGLREGDLIARYGGEEFAFIMPDSGLDIGVKVAERIRVALSAKELVKRSTGEKLGYITASFGISTLHPGDTLGDLVERADRCLYEAKNTGRNRVVDESEERVADQAQTSKVA